MMPGSDSDSVLFALYGNGHETPEYFGFESAIPNALGDEDNTDVYFFIMGMLPRAVERYRKTAARTGDTSTGVLLVQADDPWSRDQLHALLSDDGQAKLEAVGERSPSCFVLGIDGPQTQLLGDNMQHPVTRSRFLAPTPAGGFRLIVFFEGHMHCGHVHTKTRAPFQPTLLSEACAGCGDRTGMATWEGDDIQITRTCLRCGHVHTEHSLPTRLH